MNQIDQTTLIIGPLYLIIGLIISYLDFHYHEKQLNEFIEEQSYFLSKRAIKFVLFIAWLVCIITWPHTLWKIYMQKNET
jgi:hypothetical protein